MPRAFLIHKNSSVRSRAARDPCRDNKDNDVMGSEVTGMFSALLYMIIMLMHLDDLALTNMKILLELWRKGRLPPAM